MRFGARLGDADCPDAIAGFDSGLHITFVWSTREPGDLFGRADAAVYDAKARGRGAGAAAGP